MRGSNNPTTEDRQRPSRRANLSWLALAVLGGTLVWGYWTTLAEVGARWWHDPQYNHGFLVPLFAGMLLWLRRQRMPAAPWQPSWWGLLPLAGGVALRLTGAWFYLPWFDAVSLLPVTAGLFVLLGGWAALGWAWPAVAFLGFMIPLPYGLHVALAPPLQKMAAEASAYVLQTVGYCVVVDGTTLRMNETTISVVSACSGLSMLMTFFALATALVLVLRRPLRDKVAILVSAVPVALVANVARIVLTGVLYKTASGEAARAVFHDLAGWLMMPLALLLLGLELKLLSWLVVEEAPAAPLRADLAEQPRSAPARTPSLV
jgi:exosortase